MTKRSDQAGYKGEEAGGHHQLIGWPFRKSVCVLGEIGVKWPMP